MGRRNPPRPPPNRRRLPSACDATGSSRSPGVRLACRRHLASRIDLHPIPPALRAGWGLGATCPPRRGSRAGFLNDIGAIAQFRTRWRLRRVLRAGGDARSGDHRRSTVGRRDGGRPRGRGRRRAGRGVGVRGRVRRSAIPRPGRHVRTTDPDAAPEWAACLFWGCSCVASCPTGAIATIGTSRIRPCDVPPGNARDCPASSGDGRRVSG